MQKQALQMASATQYLLFDKRPGPASEMLHYKAAGATNAYSAQGMLHH
jgi:hypothetical protein